MPSSGDEHDDHDIERGITGINGRDCTVFLDDIEMGDELKIEEVHRESLDIGSAASNLSKSLMLKGHDDQFHGDDEGDLSMPRHSQWSQWTHESDGIESNLHSGIPPNDDIDSVLKTPKHQKPQKTAITPYELRKQYSLLRMRTMDQKEKEMENGDGADSISIISGSRGTEGDEKKDRNDLEEQIGVDMKYGDVLKKRAQRKSGRKRDSLGYGVCGILSFL